MEPPETLPLTTPQAVLAGTLAYITTLGDGPDQVITHSLASGDLEIVLSEPAWSVTGLAWAPSGECLVLARETGLVSKDHWLARYSPDGTGGEPIFDQSDRHESGPAFSPDGRLAYRSTEKNVALFDGPYLYVDETNVATARFNGPPGWRHDRAAVVVARYDGLYDVEVPSGRWVRLLASQAATYSPHVSILGHIAYGEAGRIWVANGDGLDPRPLTTGPEDDCPRWSPDGSHIAFTRGNGRAVRVMRFADGADWLVAETRAGGNIRALVWAPGSEFE